VHSSAWFAVFIRFAAQPVTTCGCLSSAHLSRPSKLELMRESPGGFPVVKKHYCYAVTTESLWSEAIEPSGVPEKSSRLIGLLMGSTRIHHLPG